MAVVQMKREFMKNEILHQEISVNQGHDLVEIVVLADDPHHAKALLILSSGNIKVTVDIDTGDDKTLRKIGNALIAAAMLIGE